MKNFLLLFFIVIGLSGCSVFTSDEVSAPQQPVAKSTSAIADNLYAKAYVLWGHNEQCSDPEKAMALLNSALDEDPKHAPALFRRGLVFEQLGYDQDAFDNISEAISIAPRAEYHAWRAYLLMKEGNTAAAEMDLQRSYELEKNNRYWHAFSGVLALMNGNEKSACSHFRDAAKRGVTSWLEKAQSDNMCK